MVVLSLVSPKGNPSARFFPYAGYLGLTPVTVEGIVRTRLDEDRKPVPAKAISISVRCYHSRHNRAGAAVHTVALVDHTLVLWHKPPHLDWADVADLDLPFKISLPKRTPGPSTANFQICRSFWRIEACLDHIPIFGVGHRMLRHFDLPLVRYDLPSIPPLLPVPAAPLTTAKPRAPVLRYSLTTPTHPVGPHDLLFAALAVSPLDPSVSVRSASLSIERRIDLRNPSVSSSSDDLLPSAPASPFLHPTEPDSPLDPTPSSSALTLDDSRLLLSPHPKPSPPSPSVSPTQTITATIATAETALFTRDTTGAWSTSITLPWPAAPAHSRWALGETMCSDHATVRFYLCTAVRVSCPSWSGSTDVLELEPREVLVAGTGEAERRLALDKWAEMREAADRSKSKSPWRERGGRSETDESHPNPPPSAHAHRDRLQHAPHAHRPHSPHAPHHHHQPYPPSPHPHPHPKGAATAKKHAKTPRRPHTSAGPRDKAAFAYLAPPAVAVSGGDADAGVDVDGYVDAGARADARSSFLGVRAPGESVVGDVRRDRENRDADTDADDAKGKSKRAKTKERDVLVALPPHPAPALVPSSSQSSSSACEHVRAWEEELARIEVKSRRSSLHLLSHWGPWGRRSKGAQQVQVSQT